MIRVCARVYVCICTHAERGQKENMMMKNVFTVISHALVKRSPHLVREVAFVNGNEADGIKCRQSKAKETHLFS